MQTTCGARFQPTITCIPPPAGFDRTRPVTIDFVSEGNGIAASFLAIRLSLRREYLLYAHLVDEMFTT
jgi:hypothetical protein